MFCPGLKPLFIMTDCSTDLKASARRCAAHSGDESAEFGGIFFAGCTLDGRNDLNPPWVKEVNGAGDIVRVQTSADDDRRVLFDALDQRKSGLPVEGLARSSTGGGRTGIEE